VSARRGEGGGRGAARHALDVCVCEGVGGTAVVVAHAHMHACLYQAMCAGASVGGSCVNGLRSQVPK